MTDCELCGTEITKQPLPETQHHECIKEWKRRFDAGKCVNCGVRQRINLINNHLCNECDIDFPYEGYPGESA